MDTDEHMDLIRVKLASMDNPRWDEQKEAVKALDGATFHKNAGTWTIEIDRNALPVDTINRLYEIAAEYGTRVRIIISKD
ncbi:hypothetical protein ACFV4N_05270 [Actinosynnema sp. NPDC059797]